MWGPLLGILLLGWYAGKTNGILRKESWKAIQCQQFLHDQAEFSGWQPCQKSWKTHTELYLFEQQEIISIYMIKPTQWFKPQTNNVWSKIHSFVCTQTLLYLLPIRVFIAIEITSLSNCRGYLYQLWTEWPVIVLEHLIY